MTLSRNPSGRFCRKNGCKSRGRRQQLQERRQPDIALRERFQSRHGGAGEPGAVGQLGLGQLLFAPGLPQRFGRFR